jgi:hypothetical protein
MLSPKKLAHPFLREDLDLEEAVREAEFHRNVLCIHYDACLSHACLYGWLSFTCTQCVHKDEVPTMPFDTHRTVDSE